MSEEHQSEPEGVELLSGYSTKKVVSSVALACVLHVVVLTGYVILGHSKKPKTEATAEAKAGDVKTKPDTKAPGKDDKVVPSAKPEGKAGDQEAPKSSDPKKSMEEKKNTEIATPNEIPKAPDNDLDDIIKRK